MATVRTRALTAGRARLDDERGSLLLALLVAILAMTMAVGALASARVADRAVRRDVSYATVVQAADAGVQHALSRLNQQQVLASQVTPVPIGDHEFTYAVTPVVTSSGSLAYEVQATGTAPDGEQRVVVARLEQESRLPYALFTNLSIDFRGANLVDSYSSVAVCNSLPGCAWDAPYDGLGMVGSNNSVLYPGNADADKTILFDYDANPDPLRCRENRDPCDPPADTEDDRLDLTTADQLAFIDDMTADCDARVVEGWHDWTSSDSPASPAVLTPPATPLYDFLCVDDLVFDEDTVLAPIGGSLDARPVVMVVRGAISIGDPANNSAGAEINCTGTCQQDTSVQYPRRLQIYSATAGTVTINPQTGFAGVVYAPRRTCQTGASANVEYFGALVCDGISQVGGWELHYDRALAGIGTGRYVVGEWREELAP